MTGVAWTGTGTVVSKIEISTDDGESWQDGTLHDRGAAGHVAAVGSGRGRSRSAGDQRVRARATDTSGNTQPDRATPNPAGYGNNSIHEVRVHAR